MQGEIDFLQNIIGRERLNKMSGKQKLVYKYCICSMFINLITGNHYTEAQKISIQKADEVMKLPRKQTNFDGIIARISSIVNSSLEKNYFKPPYDEDFLNNIIKFFRERLKELKEKKKSLFLVSEFSRYIDLKKHFNIEAVSNHHWIEFSLLRGFMLTIPECIVFSDLKVQWNFYIDIKSKLEAERKLLFSEKEIFEYYKKEDTRENLYKLAALHRSLIFIGVSFVEAYLYNLFYCIKNTYIEGKEGIKDLLEMKKIEDEQIVKQVIYHLFPSSQEVLMESFSKYKKVIKYRDRYVHASPFIDHSTGICETQPLLNLNYNQLVEYLQVCIDFVHKIDNILPNKLKLLFWWYNETINFENFEKISLVNKDSRINKTYYET
ncbi:hypothetical protein [Clostridium sp. JS66]|uniref:hypothetical protein n=1 Tax=Clostridium sp. JS66 TaxID=3064705 RepID=UPI00298DCE29|nr:hypothetical protein [Clostridium sp. JS66]WPC43360.1 hypothetical protein Q6H37_07785 [Clostridium sp. JS66]